MILDQLSVPKFPSLGFTGHLDRVLPQRSQGRVSTAGSVFFSQAMGLHR